MELAKRNKNAEDLQTIIIENNHLEGFHGDGISIAEIPDVPVTHEFVDGVYIRKMTMPKGELVVGAIHNHLHIWFLMKGRVLISDGGEEIEHVAPCYTISEPGSKRLIYAVEDSIFVNIHKNPSNTKDMNELQEEIVSMTQEQYNKKYK
jgi:quercetin dioxygenase-like cupin family protein